MNIYRIKLFKNGNYVESYLVDGETQSDAADKFVRVLIDNGEIIPSSFEIEVKKVIYNGRDYVEVEDEEYE